METCKSPVPPTDRHAHTNTHQVRTKPAVLSQLAWRNYCKRSLHLVAQLFIKSIPKHSCLLNSPNRPTLFINRLDYLIIISAQTPSGWNFWSDYQDTIVENGEILAQWMSQCTEILLKLKVWAKGGKTRLDWTTRAFMATENVQLRCLNVTSQNPDADSLTRGLAGAR